jgi:hypothetical protein
MEWDCRSHSCKNALITITVNIVFEMFEVSLFLSVSVYVCVSEWMMIDLYLIISIFFRCLVWI